LFSGKFKSLEIAQLAEWSKNHLFQIFLFRLTREKTLPEPFEALNTFTITF